MKLAFTIYPKEAIKSVNSNKLSKIVGSIGITDIKSPVKPYTNPYNNDYGIFSGTIARDDLNKLVGIDTEKGYIFVYEGQEYSITYLGLISPDGGGRRRIRKTRRVKRKGTKAKKSRKSRR